MSNLTNNIDNDHISLRVAFIAGTLGQGGAEKQLTYMLRVLLQSGVDIRLCTLTHGEHYEAAIKKMGIYPLWIGKYKHPLLRLLALLVALRDFKPHILHSAHFYTNLYAGLIAPFYGAVSLGSIRSDVNHELKSNPFWGRLLLSTADILVANSQTAVQNLCKGDVSLGKVIYLPNVIDWQEFDQQSMATSCPLRLDASRMPTIIVTIGRLITVKRFDRFINAIAIARQKYPSILGIIVGEGPDKEKLQLLARMKGVAETHLIFLGSQVAVPAILKQSHIFLQTSDHEGFPNVLLEAMAAGLPVITTPAGDSAQIIQNGRNGFIVPYDDIELMAQYISILADSVAVRKKLGQAGRAQVEQIYGIDKLSVRLLSIYDGCLRDTSS